MLFEDEGKTLSKELFERLRDKAQEVAKALKETKDQNAKLKAELASAKEELEKVKKQLGFYEGERQELKSTVEELLKEFEQVSQ
jgi:septal ring factor EnvC (AmiA/AmiB activator)